MTIQEAAQTALDVQDACNLSGVLATFDEIVQDVIWPEAGKQGKGTAFVNEHPIVTLFLDKLSDLNGLRTSEDVSICYCFVEALARGEEVQS